jgi:hypothetical protein
MTRGDSAICGTTTTGTGTLTLAACPTPPGGIDFDVLCRAMGFGNNSANIISYTIIEYTNNTFATARQHEKGVGILTLGSSAGIANCTLARTTKQSSATSLDSQPATQTFAPSGGITIGNAANTLVFIGPSAMDIPAWSPYYDTGYAVGAVGTHTSNSGQTLVGGSGAHHYNAFEWRIPMLAKSCYTFIWSPSTGTTNAWAAIYAIGTNGRPGKLLIDFGLLGTAGASLNTGFTNIGSAVHSTGFFMMPGEYFFNFRFTISGGTVGSFGVIGSNGGERLMSGRIGTSWSGGFPIPLGFSDTGGVVTPAPDPAYITGWGSNGGQNNNMLFLLAP